MTEHRHREFEREMARRSLRSGAHVHNLSEQNITRGTEYERDFFIYPLNVGNLAAGATFNGTINIMADSDFEWMQTTTQGNLHGAAEPWSPSVLIPATLLLTDGGTGRQLMQVPVPLNSLAGRGELPFILPQERYFLAKATIQFQVTSFSASTWDNIFINLIGAKLFAKSR